MITRLLQRADDVLHARPWVVQEGAFLPRFSRLAMLLVFFGLLYGAVMGSYGGLWGKHLLQMTYSALKVPVLLMGTFLLSVPSFFVMNTLAGLREDFAQAMRALLATQSGLTIILASLAPLTALWYVSFEQYQWALLFNAGMFGMASILAQRLLKAYYRPLIQRDRRHRWLLRGWLVIYAFVGIQMGWLLRPFVGDPTLEPTFFRHDVWGNAYEVLLRVIWGSLR